VKSHYITLRHRDAHGEVKLKRKRKKAKEDPKNQRKNSQRVRRGNSDQKPTTTKPQSPSCTTKNDSLAELISEISLLEGKKRPAAAHPGELFLESVRDERSCAEGKPLEGR